MVSSAEEHALIRSRKLKCCHFPFALGALAMPHKACISARKALKFASLGADDHTGPDSRPPTDRAD